MGTNDTSMQVLHPFDNVEYEGVSAKNSYFFYEMSQR